MQAGPGVKRATLGDALLSGAAALRHPLRAAAAASDDESAQRLAAVLEAAELGVFDVDAGLRIAWTSRAAWPGLDATTPLGRTPAQLLGDSDGQRWVDAAAHVMAGAAPLRVGVTVPGAGARRQLDHLITPRSDADGHLVGLRVVVSDTTQRRALQQRQRDAEELLRVAVELSGQGFEVLRPLRDAGGCVVDFVWESLNAAAAAWLGATPEALVGQRVGSTPPGWQAARLAHWIGAMDGGAPTRAEVAAGDGARVEMRCIGVGDRLVATTWLDAARRQGGGLTDELLSNLSHELRTPLNAILGWAHVLGRGGADDALLHRAADAIARNVRAQSALVDELLDLGRLSAGTLRLAAADCDAAAVLREAADGLEPLARARWVAVDRTGIADGSLPCRGDAARLAQAFRHVIDNALKHAPLDGTVRVTGRRDGTTLVVEVADDGEGIAPERLPHVFDGLRRDEGAPRHGGLGIGLALVRGLVELHGGRVAVASDGPGRGTTVRIELPAAAAPEARVAAPEASAVLPVAPPPGALAWRRILLLEDDADTLEVTSLLLREQGAIVRAYDNAEQALAAAEHGSFDLVVSDLGMPGMDGLEFMRRLRDAAGDVAAIALTAYAGDEPRRQALAAGFRRVETKPIAAPRLLHVVTEELSRAPAAQ